MEARANDLANVEARLMELKAKAERPKAAVEPFHVNNQPNGSFASAFSSTQSSNQSSPQRSVLPPPVASRAGLKLPIPVSRPSPLQTSPPEKKPSPNKTSVEVQKKPNAFGKGPAPQPPRPNNGKNGSESPGGSDGGERSSLSSSDSGDRMNPSINRRAPVMQTLMEGAPTTFPDVIPDPPRPPQDSEVEQPNPSSKYAKAEPDMLHIRLDNLRAAKRRSWASNNQMEVAAAPGNGEEIGGETEHIRRMLAREQARGKSNINFSWVFDPNVSFHTFRRSLDKFR